MREILRFRYMHHLKSHLNVFKNNFFDVFLFISISIAVFLGYITSLLFFTYTFMWLMIVYINKDSLKKIDDQELWEFILALLITIFSLFFLTPIKHIYFPQTKNFGVINAGLIILSVFMIFFGVKNYKKTIPLILFYLLVIVINGTWSLVFNKVAENYLAPLSAHGAYTILTLFGYPSTINGTTITIITQNGESISATVASSCSGIMGMFLSIIILTGLMMGTNIDYLKRIIFIMVGAITMFCINMIRLALIFIAAYYWGRSGLDLGHEWFGTILFLTFVIGYYSIIDKKFNKISGDDHETK